MEKRHNVVNRIIKYLMWSSLLIFVYMICGVIFNGNHVWMSLVVQVSTILITYVYIQITKCTKIVNGFLYLILPFMLLFIIPSICFQNSFKFSWIYLVMIPVLFIITWFLQTRKYIIYLIILLLPLITSVYLFPNILTYNQNLNPKIGHKYSEIKLIDINGNSIKFDYNKIILLDFWSTKCGICYKKFPDLEKLYFKYKKNNNVEIYSVHVPFPNDNFNKTVQLVNNLGYKFPTLFAVSKNETLDKLSFNTFPHYVIIQNNIIQFSGSFQIENNLIIGNSEKEIDKLLLTKN